MDLKYDIRELKEKLNNFTNEIVQKFVRRVEYNNIIRADITEVVRFFKHLEIDPDYKIIVSYRRLGVIIAGKVFAVRKEYQMYDGFLDNPNEYYGGFEIGQYPPLEVVFCDGTAEGYLETAIFDNVLEQISRCSENPLKDFVFCNDIIRESSKPFIIKPNNWLPKYFVDFFGRKTLLTYEYDYLNGISLCQYIFLNGSTLDVNEFNTVYKSHVSEFNERFSEKKQCCIFKRSEIVMRDGDEAYNIIY